MSSNKILTFIDNQNYISVDSINLIKMSKLKTMTEERISALMDLYSSIVNQININIIDLDETLVEFNNYIIESLNNLTKTVLIEKYKILSEFSKVEKNNEIELDVITYDNFYYSRNDKGWVIKWQKL